MILKDLKASASPLLPQSSISQVKQYKDSKEAV